MPYQTVEEVVQRFPKLGKYPREAQEMFLTVLNAALEQYPLDEGKAIATAWAAVNRKYGRRDDARLRFMSAQQVAPFTEYGGVISTPTIFTREGVQNGGLKPADELRRAAPTLEGKPVIFRHPPEDRPIDPARDPVIGWASGVSFREKDHAVHGLTNIRVAEAPAEFIQELRRGEAREGSVGYWSESEYTAGEFNGVPYERVERNIVFDHYAVGIPLGACSVQDGCGLGFDHMQGGRQMSETIDLTELEGERTVCLSRLKEFLLDVFRRNYRKASEDTPWSLDESKYTVDQLRMASAVVTGPSGANGEYTKADCHLPHHLPGDGKTHGGTLVWRGVDAAGKALMGSRGGVKLPADATAKAKSHLERHYHEFDKKAPWEQKGDENVKLDAEEKAQYEAKIAELEQAKAALEAEKAEAEKAKTETEERLKAYVEKEQAEAERQRSEALSRIKEAIGEEDAEKLKDWTLEQLATFEQTLKKAVDKTALTPGAGQQAGKTSLELRGKGLTVGSLMGKKPGES